MNCKDVFEAEIIRTGSIDIAYKNLSKDCKDRVNYFPDLSHKKRYKLYKRLVRALTEESLDKLTYKPVRKFRERDIDHIIPVSLGFKLNIPPYLMASLDNLQAISNEDNLVKSNNITERGQMLLNGWGIKY